MNLNDLIAATVIAVEGGHSQTPDDAQFADVITLRLNNGSVATVQGSWCNNSTAELLIVSSPT